MQIVISSEQADREKQEREVERIDRLPAVLQRLAVQHQLDQFLAEPSVIERQARALRASSLRVS